MSYPGTRTEIVRSLGLYLVYIASSRLTRATEWDAISKNKQTKYKENGLCLAEVSKLVSDYNYLQH